ncbi:MAG: hypothetical protein GXN99_00655 [Candidatus Nanohaloarchaeota archaeon]|nr:hypothetical protein [Candidatus Nanohaloarchaeota archaeon]
MNNARKVSDGFTEASTNYTYGKIEKLLSSNLELNYVIFVFDPETYQSLNDGHFKNPQNPPTYEEFFSNTPINNDSIINYFYEIAKAVFPNYDKIPDKVGNCVMNYIVPDASDELGKYDGLVKELLENKRWVPLLIVYSHIREKSNGLSLANKIREQIRRAHSEIFNPRDTRKLQEEFKELMQNNQLYDAGALIELYKVCASTQLEKSQSLPQDFVKKAWSFIFKMYLNGE